MVGGQGAMRNLDKGRGSEIQGVGGLGDRQELNSRVGLWRQEVGKRGVWLVLLGGWYTV